MMLQVENEHNKYELERERQEKEIIEKNLDYTFYPFEHEYFKVKKWRLLKK